MLDVDIYAQDERWGACDEALEGRIEHALRLAIEHSDDANILSTMTCYELALVLGNDADVRRLNRDYRGRDKPTNVLSFPGGGGGSVHVEGQSIHLGDIILGYETVVREALEQKKPLAHHLLHLCVHGCLHLLGYDHIRDEDAEIMEDLERQILKTLGISDPYADMKQVEHS